MPDGISFADSSRLRWLDVPGTGDPVVYLHGLGCHGAASWAGVAARFGRRALIVDLPGHGRSDAPPRFAYSLPEMAAVVARLIESIGGTLDVVGHSLGGSIAVALAHQHPTLVRRTVLVEPAIDVQPASPHDIASISEEGLTTAAWHELLDREEPWRRADVKLTDPIALVRCARALGDEHAEKLHDQLTTMPVPTTLVRGDMRDYENLAEIRAAGVRDRRVAGARHFVMNDEPEAFDAVLRQAFA